MQTRRLGQTDLQSADPQLWRELAGRGVSQRHARRGARQRPRGAGMRAELHRHLAVLRPRDERSAAGHRAARRAARQLHCCAPSWAATISQHFDFSARRVAESVDVSLHRLGTDHLDIMLCHDIEFVPMQQIVDETLPALRKIQQAGKVRYIGFSGYPMKIFRFILRPDARRLRAQLQPIHAAEHALRRRGRALSESARQLA